MQRERERQARLQSSGTIIAYHVQKQCTSPEKKLASQTINFIAPHNMHIHVLWSIKVFNAFALMLIDFIQLDTFEYNESPLHIPHDLVYSHTFL